jgi:hypothetical protein
MKDDRLESRRRFLAKCGKFAIVTPPAITLMLAASSQNFAVAASGGNNGFGNGGGDGVPGNSLGKGHGPDGPINDVNR